MDVCACLLLCFVFMFVYLDLDFAMLCALFGLVFFRVLGLLACVVAYVPLMVCLGVTTYETHLCDVGVLDTHLSPLHVMMLCLPC